MRSTNMVVLTADVKALHPGVTVYGVGDAAHKLSPSGHNEDDTRGSRPEQEDPDSKPEHRAIDIMLGKALSYAAAWSIVTALVTLKINTDRLYYVIFDGWIWRRNGGWKREVYTGRDKHRDHIHVSGNWPDDENANHWTLRVSARPAAPSPGEDFIDMRGIVGNLAGRATLWYGQLGVVPLRALADPAAAEALGVAGAVSRTFTTPNALVEALGCFDGDPTGEASRTAVSKAG